MKTYFRILSYIRPVGVLMPQYLLYTVLGVIFSIVNIAVMIPLLKVLFGVEDAESMPQTAPNPRLSLDYLLEVFNYYFGVVVREYGELNSLYFICGFVIAATILANLFKYLSNLMVMFIRINVINNVETDFFNHLLGLDITYFTTNRKGDLISRGTSDIFMIESSVISSFNTIFKDPLTIILLFVVLFKMSSELTLYTILIIPFAGFFISQFAKRLRKGASAMQQGVGRIGSALDESITGIRIIKGFTAEKQIHKKYMENVSYYTRYLLKMAKSSNLAPSVSEILGAATLATILLIGGNLIFRDQSSLEAADFIGFIVLFSQILAPAKSITNGLSTISKGIASADRVFEFMDSKRNIPDEGQEQLKTIEKISFDHVHFSYGEKQVIYDISFEIPRGKVVALVGPSGGGKSTLADLLVRFYDPNEGAILFDGKNIKDFDLTAIRKNMGIVTQESILFHDTVFNNIAFGHPEMSLEKVQEAAKIANAHEFVEALEDGYHTLIGERGTKLSGGQRQRLSIARAVLKNPPILILDEATSALDSESEKLVQEAISNLMKNRTTLVIAHRLSTIQNADRILVIQEGRILQQGTHEQLTKQGGLYKKLTDIQSV